MAEDTEVQDLAKESGSNLDIMNNLLDKGGEVDGDASVDGPEGGGEEEDPADEPEALPAEEEIEQELEHEEEPPAEEEEEVEEEEALDELEDEAGKKTSAEPPLFRELQKKNPELFKGPLGKQLRTSLFREHRFSQVFGSIEEATDAAARVEDFQEFEGSILEGDAKRFVGALAATNKQSLHKFVDNLLPALYEGDKDVYSKVTSKVLVNALGLAKQQGMAAIKGGDDKRGKNLVNSVHQLANLIWPSLGGNLPEFPEEKENPEVSNKLKELEERERQFLQKAGGEFQKSVKGVSIKLARKKILAGLDPNNSLPDFVKDSIVDKTLREIGELMDSDPQHIASMQRLWQRAVKQGFPKELQAKLISTYLGRASQLIGPTRRKYLTQATGKPGAAASGDDRNRPPLRKPVGQGATGGRQKTGTVPSSEDIDWRKTTPMDVLKGKVTLKKR